MSRSLVAQGREAFFGAVAETVDQSIASYLSQSILGLDPSVPASLRDSSDAEAGFLDTIAEWQNQGTGASDATQATALNQPTLINEQGLYTGEVAENYAEFNGVLFDFSADWSLETEIFINDLGDTKVIGMDGVDTTKLIAILPSGAFDIRAGGTSSGVTRGVIPTSMAAGGQYVLRAEWTAALNQIECFVDGVSQGTATMTAPVNMTINRIGSPYVFSPIAGFRSFKINDTERVIDFTDPAIPHGATSFVCETGQTVTINQSGNNPARIIRDPEVFFDGLNNLMTGLYGSTLSDARLVAVIDIHGDGGGTTSRIFESLDSNGIATNSDSAILALNNSGDFRSYFANSSRLVHADAFSGAVLIDIAIGASQQSSKINGVEVTDSQALTLFMDAFALGGRTSGDLCASMSVRHLQVHPAATDTAPLYEALNTAYQIY